MKVTPGTNNVYYRTPPKKIERERKKKRDRETATMAALGLDIRRHAVQNQRVQLLLHMLAVVVSTCGIEQLQPARALSHSHAHAAGTTCTDLGFSGLQLCSDCKLMSTIVTNNGKPKTKDEKKKKRKRKKLEE